MATPLAVLIIEDSDSDAQLIVRLLTKAGYDLTFEIVETAEHMRAALEQATWDIIISDYSLPQFDGAAALQLLQETGLDLPFIVVSGTMGEETAVAMMRAGAQDYLMKDNLARLAPAVERELREANMRRERQRAEQALRESESRYRTLFEQASDGISYLSTDLQIVAVNESFARMHGYSVAEMQNMSLQDLDTPETARWVPERAAQLMAGGSLKFEVEHYHKDGHIFPLEVSANLASIGSEQYVLSFHRDITERKRAEEALRESENKYRQLFETESDALFLIDNETGAILEANVAATALYGYSHVELLRLRNTDLSAQPDETRRATSAKQPLVPLRNHRKKDGTVVSVEITSSHLVWHDRPAHIAAIRDSTARIKAQAAQRESEERFRLAFQQNAMGMALTGTDGRFLLVNQKLCNILGYAEPELIAKTFQDVTLPEDRAIGGEAFRQLLAGECESAEIEKRYVRKDGTPVWTRVASSPVRNLEGQPLYFVSQMQDITERKRAEEALVQAAERLSLAQRSAGAGMWNWDITTGKLNWSAEFFQLFGLDPAKTDATFDVWRNALHPDDRQRAEDRINEAIQNHTPLANEYRIVLPSGEICWINALGDTMYDEQGEAKRMSGICIDITERKRTEEKLRQSESKYRLHFENVADVIYSIDQEFRITEVSPSVERILGYPPSELIGKSFAEIDVLTPEYFQAAIADTLRVFAGERVIAEYAFKAKNGERIFGEVTGSPLRGANDEIVGVLSVARDITERKRAEEKLQQSEEEYRRLVNVLPSGVVVHSQGQIALVNRAGNRFFGAPTPEQLIGTLLLERVHPDFRNVVRERVRKPQELGKEAEPIEEKLVRLDGSAFDAQVSAIAVNFAGKPATLAVFNDITERKQRERELEAVATMSAAMRRARTRVEMLPVIASQVATLVNAASVGLLFADDQTGDFVIEHVQGVWANNVGQHLPRTTGILRQVLDDGKPYLTNDLPNDPNFFLRDSIQDLRAFIEIPLVTQEATIGFLAVASKNVFNEQDVRVLTAISDIAANAIHRAFLHEQTEHYAADLRHAYDTTLEGWAHALELRDQETEGHTRRVVQITVELARKMGIGESELEHIRRGALLHDIGKMAIPDSILLKPGTLNEREWEIMRQHPDHAYRLLMPIEYLHPAMDIPYCHHEKWDGTGYPRELKGEQIPLAARIFAIVDVWDALCSNRPYRLAWAKEQASKYLQAECGKHFDPKVVEAFLKII